ncbi:MAG: 1-(5-phosphoribosyl)-5-[(5-phosphoribosylamino)methylideneamino]imidazole-4-carboxamide isomerase [Ruminococcaceae bacterium]|nr:1-(5-phosphoribosyl)-5-[(5-phosphoribosylamino)methylideneamino]imidazole-4-carboxamide isomerase [Oscillospiraceae bacterium]
MNIFPAIDLIDGKAVRLFKGDYDQKTVFSDDPVGVAIGFREAGAEYLHLVDLDGAKSGKAENLALISEIIKKSGLKVEVGGGIRTEETIRQYVDIGVLRVILGTIAVTDREFLREMVAKYGDRIAVGVDIKDGMVATHGWMNTSGIDCFDFMEELQSMGVKTVICTDISKDGAMAGTNLELYRELLRRFDIDLVASGGVSSMADVTALREMNIYGAILGKALYVGGIDLPEAIRAAK